MPAAQDGGAGVLEAACAGHSFATALLDGGADIRYAQKQLGHSSTSLTTDPYGHVQVDRHADQAGRILDRYFTGS